METPIWVHRTTVPTVISCNGVVPFKRLGHSTNIFSRVPSGMLLAHANSMPLLLMFTVCPTPAPGPAAPMVW